ncbi:DNA/pantothenate metabolism flavo protein [Pseudomassariella vexata]|uniref:DNA/pantothenate metabolism flavo protein n=1 Tax=Pseudomassariella vexata TaxID=1141098 RepID=A0A1Y2E762_9PEZI|nr:DNA/pantothenate metabolism flavo protein [Pseudomassariella vexata]ORY67391.1 DNA/pantothenate metabolism flavo protein [Pseudomassariella vexata]
MHTNTMTTQLTPHLAPVSLSDHAGYTPALSLSFGLPDRPPSPTSSVSSITSQVTMASASTEGTSASFLQVVENAYFSSNPPPKALAAHTAQAQSFINHHAAEGRRVVLITSGGTTVPLEKQTVRFIDNFSAGTRGATSAEYFLEAGYAVIFLHRQFSLLPYSRHYSHSTDCFLDFMHEGPDGSVVANPTHQEKMLRVLRKYNAAKQGRTLLMLPFMTITDYLHELRAIAQLMRPLGPNGLLYLAAAVSDFFVPPERMSEHKIQSTNATDNLKQGPMTIKTETRSEEATEETEEAFDNFDSSPAVPRSKRLIVDLDPVPKFLKNLVDGWAPEGMIVSFKLETDPGILVHKAKYSLNRYQHHLVIGNLLTTRKWEVVFVAPNQADKWIRVPNHLRRRPSAGIEGLVGAADRSWEQDKPLDPATLPEGEPELEIESLIIPAVEELHQKHIDSIRAKA